METRTNHRHQLVGKKFRDYFFQFFMLFLAVFVGSMADNWREQIGDNGREREYMESMVRDLALDTAFLKSGFPVKEQRIKAIDTVFLFFVSHPSPKTVPFSVYRNIRRSSWDRMYSRNNGTISQLRSTGDLRLIRKADVRDSLATYDQLWEKLGYYKDAYFTGQQTEYNLIEKLINAEDLVRSYEQSAAGKPLFPLLSNSSVLRINTANLSEFLNFLYRQKATTMVDEQNFRHVKMKAAQLIKMIKKEYDFK